MQSAAMQIAPTWIDASIVVTVQVGAALSPLYDSAQTTDQVALERAPGAPLSAV